MLDDRWGHGWGWAGWTMMGLGMLGGLLLLALLVALLVRVTTSGGAASRQDVPPSAVADPRSLLDERLARGEIDLEEHAALVSAAAPEVVRTRHEGPGPTGPGPWRSAGEVRKPAAAPSPRRAPPGRRCAGAPPRCGSPR